MDSLIRIIDGEPTSGWFFKDTPKEKWRKLASLKSIEASKQLAINAKSAVNMIDELMQASAYKELGFDTFEEFLEKRIRITAEQLKHIKIGLGLLGEGQYTAEAAEAVARRAAAEAARERPVLAGEALQEARAAGGEKGREFGQEGGRGKKKETPPSYNKGGVYGTSQAYLARRLARDAPEILTEWENGTIPSMRAAAIKAGIVKQKSTVEKALALVKKMTEAERLEFKAYMDMI